MGFVPLPFLAQFKPMGAPIILYTTIVCFRDDLLAFSPYILVLTNRTFNEKAGLLLLSYTDSQNPDSITLGGFMGLFNISEFSQFITKVSSKISLERLKRLQASSSAVEHIFM